MSERKSSGSFSSALPSTGAVNSAVQLDLRALSKEAKSSPDLKDAIERALLKLVYAEKSKSLDQSSVISSSNEVIKPFLIALASKQASLVSVAVSGLHRLITNHALNADWMPRLATELSGLVGTVDDTATTVKLIQCSVALVVEYEIPLHSEDLRLCLSIALKSLTTKDAHVATVATAAIRQSFGGVFERLKLVLSKVESEEFKLASIDAQKLIHDLLKVSFGESPPWLAVDSLKTELVLEIFEELLSNFSIVFQGIKPLMELISKNLPNMIDKLFRTKKVFPIVVRLLRIILALSRSFPDIIFEHSETLFKRLILMVELENVVWLKAVVLETLHRFLSTPVFIVKLFTRFDNENSQEKLCEQMVSKISRYLKSHSTAEDAVFTSHPNKDLKFKMIDLLTATVEPAEIKLSYLTTTGVHCLTNLVDTIGLLVEHHNKEGGPVEQLLLYKSIADSAWPSILAALSHVLSVTTDEAFMQSVLKAHQSFTQSCGDLGLRVSRDAFLTSMKKIAIPVEPLTKEPSSFTQRITGVFSSAVAPKPNQTLSTKNIQTLKRLLNIAFTMGNTLGTSWEIVLDALEVLHAILYSGSSIEDAVEDELSRDELHALAGGLMGLFASSGYIADDSLVQLIEHLQKRIKSKLFPAKAEEQENLENASKQFIYANCLFSMLKLIEIVEVNIGRVSIFWDVLNDVITMVCNHGNVNVRAQGLVALSKVSSSKLQSDGTDKLELSFLTLMKALATSPFEDVRESTNEQVYALLQSSGHHLTSGWPFVLAIIKVAIQNGGKFEPKPKHVSKAFNSLQFICTDFLSSLSVPSLEHLVVTIAAYGTPVANGDINVAITAVGGLLWNVSDFFASSSTKEKFGEDSVASLWLLLFTQLKELSISNRSEIRTAALRALFGILTTHGGHLRDQEWPKVLSLMFDILDTIASMAAQAAEADAPLKEHKLGRQQGQDVLMLVHHSRNSAAKQWNETRVIALEGVLRIFKAYFTTLSRAYASVADLWQKLINYINLYWDNSSIEIALAGMKAVETMLVASADAPDYPVQLWDEGWKSYLKMSSTLSAKEEKISHTTVNTFNSSIRKLYDKLSAKFRLEAMVISEVFLMIHCRCYDLLVNREVEGLLLYNWSIHKLFYTNVMIFLSIVKPLPTLPVEYAGELSMLQTNVIEILEALALKWENSSAKVTAILLDYVSTVIGYDYRSRCFAEETSSKTPSSTSEAWNPASEKVKTKYSSLAEKSLRALQKIWGYPSLTSFTRALIFDDLLRVLGRSIQLKKIDPTSNLWVQSIELFVIVLQSGVGHFNTEVSSSSSEGKITLTLTSIEINLIWTDIVDSIETFLLARSNSNLAMPLKKSANKEKESELELKWNIVLCDCLRELVYSSSSVPLVQQRIITLLVECASVTQNGQHDDHHESLSRAAYTALATLCSKNSESLWNAKSETVSRSLRRLSAAQLSPTFKSISPTKSHRSQLIDQLIATKVLTLLFPRISQVFKAFLTDESKSADTPVLEVVFILDLLSDLEVSELLELKRPGPKAHLFELFPSLLELIGSSSSTVRSGVQKIFAQIQSELRL